jgi:hypothetical protein
MAGFPQIGQGFGRGPADFSATGISDLASGIRIRGTPSNINKGRHSGRFFMSHVLRWIRADFASFSFCRGGSVRHETRHADTSRIRVGVVCRYPVDTSANG